MVQKQFNKIECSANNSFTVLFHKYAYKSVKIDDGLPEIYDWGCKSYASTASRRGSGTSKHSTETSCTRSISSSRNTCESGRSSPSMLPSIQKKHLGKIEQGTEATPGSNHLSDSASRVIQQVQNTSPLPELQGMALDDEVLVIEALGVSDNEVFARAWCSQRGCSAVIANMKDTCMACAIREAYAANVHVVIATEGGTSNEEME